MSRTVLGVLVVLFPLEVLALVTLVALDRGAFGLLFFALAAVSVGGCAGWRWHRREAALAEAATESF